MFRLGAGVGEQGVAFARIQQLRHLALRVVQVAEEDALGRADLLACRRGNAVLDAVHAVGALVDRPRARVDEAGVVRT